MSEKELKNGLISEEALDEIAGGIKMDKESLKGYLKKAGVAVAGAAAIAASAGLAGYYGGLFGGKGEKKDKQPTNFPRIKYHQTWHDDNE